MRHIIFLLVFLQSLSAAALVDPEILARLHGNDPTLTTLNLANCHIGDSDAEEIADALTDNTALTELFLTHNLIGDYGALIFAKLLKINQTLKVLSLAHNHIGITGVMALAEALSTSTGQTELSLEDNEIDCFKSAIMLRLASFQVNTDTCTIIRRLLARNKKITKEILALRLAESRLPAYLSWKFPLEKLRQ